ncbi:MAG TPA: DMT family transporter [Chthonomonadales bacterium]|nr:DMT family transporter [Chthonomonadales bacterium]
MSIWLTFALIALVLFGLAGLSQKLSTNRASFELSLIAFTAAFALISVVIVAIQPQNWNFSGRDWFLALLAGALLGCGTLSSFIAYHSGGKASVVTPLGALYPVVTVLLAVPLLRERIELRTFLGIVTAVAAGLALSYEGQPSPEVPDRVSSDEVRG